MSEIPLAENGWNEWSRFVLSAVREAKDEFKEIHGVLARLELTVQGVSQQLVLMNDLQKTACHTIQKHEERIAALEKVNLERSVAAHTVITGGKLVWAVLGVGGGILVIKLLNLAALWIARSPAP
jgi:hypothetical protein